MESLIEKFGEPKKLSFELPYQREQILGSIDECQSLIDDLEADKTLDPEVVAQKVEMIEAMASSCDQYYDGEMYPRGTNDESTIAENAQRTVEAVQDITIRMRDSFFSLSGLPKLASLGICQHCMRVIQQAFFQGMGSETKSQLSASQIPSMHWYRLIYYLGWHDDFLITVDTWPGLPRLETRSNSSACHVCALLRESLHLPPLTEREFFESRVTLWVHCVESDDEDNPDDGDYDDNDEWFDVENEESVHYGERTKLTLLHLTVKGHDETSPWESRCTFSLETTSGGYLQFLCVFYERWRNPD